MEFWKLAVVTLVVCSCHLAVGISTYRKCKVYAKEDQIPSVQDGKGRHCQMVDGKYVMPVKGEPVPSGKNSYCLDYKCPTVGCDGADVVKEAGKCDRCKGDCEWLGKLVKSGSHGRCVDGCNTCGCSKGNVTFSTYIGCHAFFCFNQKEMN